MFWMLFTIVFIIVAAIFIYVIVDGITTYVKNNNSPVVESTAKVVDKYRRVIHHHNRVGVSRHHVWYIVFDSDGEKQEFKVGRDEFDRLNVGDTGTLKAQGTRYLGFEKM